MKVSQSPYKADGSRNDKQGKYWCTVCGRYEGEGSKTGNVPGVHTYSRVEVYLGGVKVGELGDGVADYSNVPGIKYRAIAHGKVDSVPVTYSFSDDEDVGPPDWRNAEELAQEAEKALRQIEIKTGDVSGVHTYIKTVKTAGYATGSADDKMPEPYIPKSVRRESEKSYPHYWELIK
jgi:hypothetical protein